MLKKVIFQSLALSFIFTFGAQSAESGGMPQLNPEFWISQIFWLILTFGTCLLYTSPSPRDLSTSRMPSSA